MENKDVIFKFKDLIEIKEHQVISSTFSDATIALYSMGPNEEITSEKSENNKIIYVLDQELIVTMYNQEYHLYEGDAIKIYDNVDNALLTKTGCKFMFINNI